MPSPTKDYDQAEEAVGQAFKDLTQGEDHAAKLENNLSGFEKNIDALLGSIDEPSTANRHAAAAKETKEKADKESTAKKEPADHKSGESGKGPKSS
ncbi:MAG: hypothetical protein M1812_006513 [Candelaria pacifica]|nr:MAG: hypothetical protein M1812_006513 [Candelaria pacifica]